MRCCQTAILAPYPSRCARSPTAEGGVAALARKTGLSRETLYRTLSRKGNPRLDTLTAILAAYGLRLSVQVGRVDNNKHAPA
ncbi:MAG: helix-turn-helix domain-containing protein [Woeseiaceae bacterium]|nr:helix-turn-helix domain-containing protein [Woeseiaceae bacterium]